MSKPSTIVVGEFPSVRLRRNRRQDWIRRLVREHSISVDDLILPIFLCEDPKDEIIQSFPGVGRHTISGLLHYLKTVSALKIPAIHIFPYYPPNSRHENVRELLNKDNIVCRAIASIKDKFPELGIISDVALDCYTTHGQDGLVHNGIILNDETIAVISDYAVLQASMGVDVIAPSEMMDGRIGSIRRQLDADGYDQVGILSYAAKYASAFYGPFRDAVGSKSCLAMADKKTYQMDPGNRTEAIREVAMDLHEGADMIMVKPGLPYLDVVRTVKDTFSVPTFAYQVSGEFCMLKAAADQGILDYNSCLYESLLAFKRAGADGILTYGAIDAARIILES